MVEETLDLDDIQGHVLIGFGGGHQRLVGLRVRPDRIGAARAALLPWVGEVTQSSTAFTLREAKRAAALAIETRPVDRSLKLALILSASGLSVFQSEHRPSDAIFRQPAAQMAKDLRDEVDAQNIPVGWKVGRDEASTPHVMAIFASDDEGVVSRGKSSFTADVAGSCDVIYQDCGRRIKNEQKNDREHFGFEDGISQPGPRGLDGTGQPITRRSYQPDHPLAETYAAPGKPLIWPGQYVFGYASQRPDGEGPGPVMDGGGRGLKNGSLLVFRRLRQDVAAFEAAMRTLAAEVTAKGMPVDGPTMAAWCVGRWPDGTPLTLSPAGPSRTISDSAVLKNGFQFAAPLGAADLRTNDGRIERFPGAPDDRSGFNCPFFAHIRKVNPRDRAVDVGGNGVTRRAQMLRRGITYGPAWTGADDGADRGLLFMAYMTSVQDQFMNLSQTWANNASAPPLGHGIDPIIGSPAPQFGNSRPLTRVGPGGQTVRVMLPGRWVHATGSGVFFAPGIKTLREIIVGRPV